MKPSSDWFVVRYVSSRDFVRNSRLLPAIFASLPPYSAVLIDCAPTTPDILRIRTVSEDLRDVIVYEPTDDYH